MPAFPGDMQDDQRDHKADDRIGDLKAERHDSRTCKHAETHESIDASMLAVGYERRAPESLARPKTHLRGEFIAHEADDTGQGQKPEMRQRTRVDEPLDRLAERDERTDEDREDHS